MPHDDRPPQRRIESAKRPPGAPQRWRQGSAPRGREVRAAGAVPGLDAPAPRRQLGIGLGLLVSIALHALLLLVALRLTLAPAPAELPPIAITILAPAPPPPPPAAAAEPEPKLEAPRLEPEPIAEARVPPLVKPAPHRQARPTPKRAAAQPAAEASTSGEAGGVAAGVEGGVERGTAGGAAGGKVGGVVGGSGDVPVPADRVASPPAILSQLRPAYPPVARLRGIEGLVVVELIIDRGGRVEPDSVRVRQSIADLDAAAIEAVRRWRFRPGRDAGGQPVRVVLEVPIRFQLR